MTAGSVSKTFTYDVFGNLKSVVLPLKTINYHVDAQDRRIADLEGTRYTDHYIWSGNKIIGTADESGELIARFVYGSRGHVPDYIITNTAEYMIVSNHLGSPVQVIDVNSGAVAQEIKYNRWGEIIADTNPGFQPFGFAGCLYDQDTKLCRFGVRDYDASIGRWLSKDPILFNGEDANLYGYVLQDPVNLIDPKGTNPLLYVPIVTGTVGAIIGGFSGAILSDSDTFSGIASDALSGAVTGGMGGFFAVAGAIAPGGIFTTIGGLAIDAGINALGLSNIINGDSNSCKEK